MLLGRGEEAGALVLDRTIPPCYPASSLRKLRGPHKRMEAHLVTLTERSEVFPLFQHPGTELLFMLEGEMVYGHGEATYTLGPGDALQLDGEGVHGPQELLALPIRFLSVVAYGDAQGVGPAALPFTSAVHAMNEIPVLRSTARILIAREVATTGDNRRSRRSSGGRRVPVISR